MAMEEEAVPIIMDIGSGHFKAGFAEDDALASVAPLLRAARVEVVRSVDLRHVQGVRAAGSSLHWSMGNEAGAGGAVGTGPANPVLGTALVSTLEAGWALGGG